MESRETEILVTKKRALFFTNDVNIKTVIALTPWNPGVTGQVLAGKLFGTQNLEGNLYVTNQRLRFESGKLENFLGLGNLGFDIELKNIIRVSTGRKLLKKTMVILVGDIELEFSLFGVDGLIESLKSQIQKASFK